LSSDGNPEFSTVLKVIKALGLTLHATAWPTTPLIRDTFWK
jgi:DNA-binding phage protein